MDANFTQGFNFLNFGDPLVNATFILALATVGAGLVGALIGALAVWFTARRSDNVLERQINQGEEQHREQLKQSEKQHQVQGLLEAFRVLDNNENRNARKTAYFDFFEYRRNQHIEVFTNSQVEEVIATFDVIGRLVRSKNISENDFFNVYGSLAYRCWRILEKHINEERKSRRFPKFMDNFEWLAKAGYEYWDKQGIDIKTSRLYNPDPDHRGESVDFQEEFW